MHWFTMYIQLDRECDVWKLRGKEYRLQYHSKTPFPDEELRAFYEKMQARLLLRILNSRILKKLIPILVQKPSL